MIAFVCALADSYFSSDLGWYAYLLPILWDLVLTLAMMKKHGI